MKEMSREVMEAGRNTTRSHSFKMVAFMIDSDLSPNGRLLHKC